MQGIVDSLIARYTPNPQVERDYKARAIRIIWGTYLADFFPIPEEPVGEWDDCLDRWVDAPTDNICLAISQAKRRYGHLKNKKTKRVEICEFIGRVVQFGYQAYGLPRFISRDVNAAQMAQSMNEYVAKKLAGGQL
jgi:hypothetical protein